MDFNSFDEGVRIDFDSADVKARLKAAMLDPKVNKVDFYQQTNLSPELLEQALNAIDTGDPEAARVISIAANGAGVSPAWVLAGLGPNPLSALGNLIQVAWEYVYRRNVSHEIGLKFAAWLRERYRLVGNTLGATSLYRQGVPQSVEQIAPLFEEFRRHTAQK